MTPPPSHIARQALPDHVYQLPDNMQPQPSLSRYWCRGSVTRLTTHSKYNPKGTIESFMYVFRRPGGYGLRKDNFGVCAGCVEAKVGECVEIDPVFRRAVNMLDFLIDRALRKTNEETARQGDQATEDSVDNAVQSFWQTAYDYALGCRNGFVAYDAVVRRRVNKSGLSETEYAQARQVSWSHNLQRYIAAVGTVGAKLPNNVVIDAVLEEHFQKTGRANEAEKRWYYYGTDLPSSAQAPTAAFERISASPTKLTPGGRRRRSPSFEMSPSAGRGGPSA
ncbi:uncharacterized protein EKO05_0006731 [Ascochyta rabiei]|uniref:uncharacterized protein n=1 Tax=Didymella rabiei TaxID=5454 RepID=UPI001901B57D|nr:uncharacterized protein EKO05_0006731 [Ascochyta rabiei]UPX16323.1 hypothetical protein EKO05_0006731 [Ascochyta rabiei]